MGRISKRNHGKPELLTSSVSQRPRENRYYKAGIYARLSSDQDEKKNESVETQVGIAKKFVADWNQNHPDKIEVIECYIDLGKTGSNFNREAFGRLMQDVRLGNINCVIVKDLSRFGRNYLEAGNYIEKIFPFMGVRFVAVVDRYDTGVDGNDARQMASEIKNLVNDMYAKDISMKARLSLAQRRQEGAYVGGPPPYGYVAVWEGKMRYLMPDENTAEIVRYIYRKFIETESYAAVVNELNHRRLNPPAVYKKNGEVYCPPDVTYNGWDKSAVKRILKSETYQGTLVQGRTSITARDEKNRIHKGENEWTVKKQVHEALVDEETYKQVVQIQQKQQKRVESRSHPSLGLPIEENIFDKVLFCGVCGRKMTRNSYVKEYMDGSKKRVDGYFCLNGGTNKVDCCPSSNRISKRELTNILFVLFKTELAVSLKKQKTYVEKGQTLIWQNRKKLQQKLLSVRRRRERLESGESRKYEEYRMGKLSQKDYVAYKMQNESKKQELDKQEQQFLQMEKDMVRDGETYLKAIRALNRLKKGTALTKELVETLIEKIYVYPAKRVEVLFTYADVWMEGMVEE
mgnify:CR=1 FL=1